MSNLFISCRSPSPSLAMWVREANSPLWLCIVPYLLSHTHFWAAQCQWYEQLRWFTLKTGPPSRGRLNAVGHHCDITAAVINATSDIMMWRVSPPRRHQEPLGWAEQSKWTSVVNFLAWTSFNSGDILIKRLRERSVSAQTCWLTVYKNK